MACDISLIHKNRLKHKLVTYISTIAFTVYAICGFRKQFLHINDNNKKRVYRSVYLVIWSVLRALCWHTSLRSFIEQSKWHYYDGREILPTDIGAMLFSKQLHWNLLRFTIIFNSNHGVESRNRWMQISEISNFHVRVEACIFIVSSHLIGFDLKTGSDAIRQVEWLDTMNMYDSTRA